MTNTATTSTTIAILMTLLRFHLSDDSFMIQLLSSRIILVSPHMFDDISLSRFYSF